MCWENTLDVSGNSVLFLSSLFLLIDVAPRDFLPLHKKRAEAVRRLRRDRNILGNLPAGVNVTPESTSMTIVSDNESYTVLADFIRNRSPLAKDIDWPRAIGVGYDVTSIPVAGATLEAFHPLYIVLKPLEGATRLALAPVGQLQDLDAWLTDQHQGSLTRWALVLLLAGFALQLVLAIVRAKG